MMLVMKDHRSVLKLPIELLFKVADYLSFTDLWYLASCSHSCRAIARQMIWHRYRIHLGKPQFNYVVYAALAYLDRYGYDKQHGTIDPFIVQSVANRLAIEIYDRSPLNQWENGLDYCLDKAMGLLVDHLFLDPHLDNIINPVLISEKTKSTYYSTRLGQLMISLLDTLYTTLMELFDEPETTTNIYHRLLCQHLNRQMDTITHQYATYIYNNTQKEDKVLSHNARLNVRIFVRFIGALVVQTDLFSAKDFTIMTRHCIQFFLSNDSSTRPRKKQKKTVYQLNEKEIDFLMDIFLDLIKAIESNPNEGFNNATTILNDSLSVLISKKLKTRVSNTIS